MTIAPRRAQGELNQERAKTRLVQARLTSTEAAYHEALNRHLPPPAQLDGPPTPGSSPSLEAGPASPRGSVSCVGPERAHWLPTAVSAPATVAGR